MRRTWLRGGASVLLAIAALAPRASSQTLDPVRSRSRLVYYEIYDAAAWALRVPYELAMPVVVRGKLGAYLDDLDLPPDVRARVAARIDSRVLVDEIVPFLLALKETYAPPEPDEGDPAVEAVESFDAWLRRHYAADSGVPGMEHSMFQWNRKAEPTDGPAFSLDPDLAARLVSLYDTLYLQGSSPAAALDEQLSCERRASDAALAASVHRAAPIVREIIRRVAAELGLEGDFAHTVDSILNDDDALETVTASGIEFLDQIVCKSYRVFATKLRREEQLRGWMRRELDRPGGGRLWEYLDDVTRERRYGVLIVVDGLQGHLMEGLAAGRGKAPFLETVREELRRAASLAPRGVASRPAPPQQAEFLDGLAHRDFHNVHYLPFFRDLYRVDGSGDGRTPRGIARSGISTTPTISVRNLPIAKTGAPVAGPGSTGVPNFHFVDRTYAKDGSVRGRPYYFYGNDAIRLVRLTREAGMRTLFDRLPLAGSMSCAAQYDDAAHWSIDAFVNLAVGEGTRDFGELLCVRELRVRARNERKLQGLRRELAAKRDVLSEELPWYRFYLRAGQRDDRELARRLIDEVAALEQRTLPELFVYYNPWPDHFAHFTGPFSDEILSPTGELNRLDYWLGQIAGVYRDAGVEERTLFGLAGDHGLAPVFHLLNPEEVVFDALRDEGIDFRLAKISSDEGEGPKLNNPLDPPAMKGLDVVVASTAGGNYMLDFFRDQDGEWEQQPLHRHLVGLRLLSRAPASSLDSPAPVNVIGELVSRLGGSLDYLVVREEPCGVDGGMVRVIGPRDGRVAEGFIERRGDRIRYAYRGADLLDTGRRTPYETLSDEEVAAHAALRTRCLEGADPARPATWCRESEWRELARFTPRPDSVVQLAHLYDSDRAGTVNLFPSEGVGYNSKVPGRHAGEFFHEKDAFVGIWGHPVEHRADGARLVSAVNGSVPTAIFEYLSGQAARQGEAGWGYPALGRELFPSALGSP